MKLNAAVHELYSINKEKEKKRRETLATMLKTILPSLARAVINQSVIYCFIDSHNILQGIEELL